MKTHVTPYKNTPDAVRHAEEDERLAELLAMELAPVFREKYEWYQALGLSKTRAIAVIHMALKGIDNTLRAETLVARREEQAASGRAPNAKKPVACA